jgi:uncharacterized protein YuzE
MSANWAIIQPSYDDKGDVLYLTRLAVPAARTHEDDDGWIWRYDSAGQIVGVTILDPKDDWTDSGRRMIEKLALAIGMPQRDIAALLKQTLHLN